MPGTLPVDADLATSTRDREEDGRPTNCPEPPVKQVGDATARAVGLSSMRAPDTAHNS